MKAKQVETFDALMRSGSVKRAAEILHVSQPAVSQTIARLEQHIGFKLFERYGRGLHPTGEAVLLHEEVRRIFIGIEHLDIAAGAIRRFKTGMFRIVTLPVIGSRVLPKFVGRFADRYPECAIRIDVSPSFTISDLVRARKYDLGITTLPIEQRGLEVHAIANSEHVCILPRDHRLGSREFVTPQDLAGERFISYPAESSTRRRIDALFEAQGVERKTTLEAQTDTICELVANGAGVSVVSCVLPESLTRGPLIWRRFRPRVETEIVAVRHPEQPLSRISTLFVEELQRFGRDEAFSTEPGP
ncbi:MAG: LysR family transcriptional regulator [Betaproteobacteria bacterium]|nr:LysR family transcriptional regulator [Betaproteobacteria bacterium]